MKHGRFSVWYTVDQAPEGWSYSVGRLNQHMILEHLHPPGSNVR